MRNVSTAPVIDLANLLDATIFNYLVGNNDAHGKNFHSCTRKRKSGWRRSTMRSARFTTAN